MADVSFDVALFPTEPAGETLALAKLAERLGYDGVWVGDSHIIWREMYVLMGAIASQTKRVKIGSGVTHPLVRHLSLTASGFLSLSELARGRMRIGIGIGASGPINIGVKRASRDELKKAVLSLRKLIAGEPVDLDGKEMKVMFAHHEPIPIFMAASTTGTRDLAAQIADGVIGGGRQDLLKEWVSVLRRTVSGSGRDPQSIKVVSWVPCSVGRDSKTAKDAVKPHVARSGWTSFLKMVSDGKPVAEEDRAAAERMSREYDFSHHMSKAHSHLVPDRWVDLFAAAGTPAEVKERIDEVIQAGVDIVSIVPYGNKEDIIKQVAKKVIG
ncbi:MAG: LLM class flavin-dependent oxidoreductase [Deltaproteobacteria bacterium]|nr:LLM class flavin-dependent oxidoreductase [Deltaproteobacteria bacterium]